ncbi:MAG: DeoR/GlpR family DNA-binding transcription regulator, partial [Candidatus Accumulibacter sp.]|nr:DeoR/GlpR family DNA-binding transcription regulator [Accumulibacter sp.]
MNEPERWKQIVEILNKRQFATVKDLTQILGSSAATIRRDIAKLHEAGQVRKVFGGIALSNEVRLEHTPARPFEDNRLIHIDKKEAIAIEAEKLCKDGDSIIVLGGSSCFLFAQRLAKRSIKICTNSMPLAVSLFEQGACYLIVAGGELHREPGILYSPGGSESGFYASRLFVGAQGINGGGLLESHPGVVRAVERLQEHADEVVVLADSSKFSIKARHISIPMSRISTLITDDGVTEEDL